MMVDRGAARLLHDEQSRYISFGGPIAQDADLVANVRRLCATVEGLTARLGDESPPAIPLVPTANDALQKALATAKFGVAMRRQRERLLGSGLFGEPAWDILLELFIARCEGEDMTVGNACLAASVPMTSALRHCQTLLDRRIVYRERDRNDGRRIFLRMSDATFAHITALLNHDA